MLDRRSARSRQKGASAFEEDSCEEEPAALGEEVMLPESTGKEGITRRYWMPIELFQVTETKSAKILTICQQIWGKKQ